MFYWGVVLLLAALVAGVFALLGFEVARGLLVLFTLGCGLTLWRARRGRAPRNLGPDS